MEVKVECQCGQHFKFDVEPVNGRMPVSINCPGCGGDATPAANEVIAKSFGADAIPTPPPPTSAPGAAPAGGGLRISKPALAGAAAAPAYVPAPPPPPMAQAMPKRAPGYVAAYTPAYMKDNPSIQNNNFYLGMLGACIGALMGAAGMFGMWIFMGFTIPYTGTAIGALTGFMARIFYKGTDYTLGIASAAIAFLVVAMTLFFVGGIGFFIFIIPGAVFSLLFATVFAWKVASG